MKLDCPHCQHVIEYSSVLPRFCGFCGMALGTGAVTANDIHGEETIAKQNVLTEANTIPPTDETTPYQAQFASPKRVGDYRLIRELGRGGMGIVYEAELVTSGRLVALKVLSPEIPHSSETKERFVREGQLAASLAHPNTTFIYSAGEADGFLYIAMELMPGKTLRNICDSDGPMAIETAVDYSLDIIDGLSEAHRLGVVHRDVKPSNCFMTTTGAIKVGDFGLSKSLVEDTDLTRTGAFLGTPQFATPEQVRGGAVDGRTDEYAVAATLFFLLTGQTPFRGDAAALIAQIASDEAPSVKEIRSDIPAGLARVLARALSTSPGDRFATIDELKHALQPFGSRVTSISMLGRRLPAYFIDMFILGVAVQFVLSIVLVGITFGSGQLEATQVITVTLMLNLGICISYFAFQEFFWGKTLGKRLMRVKVCNSEAVPPSFLQAIGRACLVPGTLILVNTGFVFILSKTGYVTSVAVGGMGGGVDPSTMVPQVVAGTAGSGLSILVALIYASTMRSRNGFRAIHDIVTGTSVSELPRVGGDGLLRVPTVVTGQNELPFDSIGSYSIEGVIGRHKNVTVLSALDSVLERRAWIHVAEGSNEHLARDYVQMTRPTRLHWLDGGVKEEWRWDAFQALSGAPLSVLIRNGMKFEWRFTYSILRELASELRTGLEAGDLPESLSLEQIWVDRNAHVKIVSYPLDVTPEFAVDASDPDQLWSLFQRVTETCTDQSRLPTRARALIESILNEFSASDFGLVSDRLEELAECPDRITWDMRLGCICVSMSTEAAFFSVLLAGVSLLVALADTSITALSFFVALVCGYGATVAACGMTRGGPAFRFLGITVCDLTGKPVTAMRAAVRGCIAWTPSIVMSSFSGFLLQFGVAANHGVMTPSHTLMLMLVVLGFLFVSPMLFIGAIYAVVKPERGIQDILAGTKLLPR